MNNSAELLKAQISTFNHETLGWRNLESLMKKDPENFTQKDEVILQALSLKHYAKENVLCALISKCQYHYNYHYIEQLFLKLIVLNNALLNESNNEGITPLKLLLLSVDTKIPKTHAQNIALRFLEFGASLIEATNCEISQKKFRNLFERQFQHNNFLLMKCIVHMFVDLYKKEREKTHFAEAMGMFDNETECPELEADKNKRYMLAVLMKPMLNSQISEAQKRLSEEMNRTYTLLFNSNGAKIHPIDFISTLHYEGVRQDGTVIAGSAAANILHVISKVGNTFYKANPSGDLIKKLHIRKLLTTIPKKNKININHQEACHRTPLHVASYQGNILAMKALIQYDANLEINDADNKTPLFYALDSKNIDAVRILVAAKADVNAKTENNVSLLHYATERGLHEAVEVLIEADAQLEAHTDCDKTPLHNASSNGNKDTVSMLISYGADINARTKGGWNALHYAAYAKSTEVVKELIASGISTEIDPQYRKRTLAITLKAIQLLTPENLRTEIGTVRI